ncbi:hypothetical protein GGR57DRAFT_453217 [Xylariaceae sp. FL1272]|nr:hypothetical protein GGR57DRAFT_453217 [Xylariaceae sp. FL1272]
MISPCVLIYKTNMYLCSSFIGNKTLDYNTMTMRRCLRVFVHALLVQMIHSVKAQDPGTPDPDNHFIFPPLPGARVTDDETVFWNNQEIVAGKPQTQPFTWTSNLPNMRVRMQQEGISDGFFHLTNCIDGKDNFIYWDGDLHEIDLQDGNRAYLVTYNCSDPLAPPIFMSHYFNLTLLDSSSDKDAKTLSTATQTSTSTSESISASITIPIASSSATATNSIQLNAASSTSSASSIAIGAGVGGGVGGAIFVVGIIFALMRYRRRAQHHNQRQKRVNDVHSYPTDGRSYNPGHLWRTDYDTSDFNSLGPAPAYKFHAVSREPIPALLRSSPQYAPHELLSTQMAGHGSRPSELPT